MNSKKGISLVALVVTIVVLLIIVAISVSFISGPESITSKSEGSKLDTRYASIMDRVKVRETELKIEEYKDKEGTTAQEFVDELLEAGLILPSEDAYTSNFSKIYLGKGDDGTYEFNGAKYKYEIDIIDIDRNIETGPVVFTFNLAGGKIGGSSENQKRSGESGTNSSTPGNPTRANYTFKGWSPSVPSKFDKSKTFIAQWTPNNNTFTFNLAGGNIDGKTTNQTRTGAYGTEYSKPKNPVRANYTFKGWSPSVPKTFDGNKTFTAQWEPAKYTITYNLNGGKYKNSAINPTRQVAYNTMPPELEPEFDSKYFIGWTPALGTATKNQTYTAIWSTPMILEMKKASVNEEVVVPLEIGTGNFAMISNNGGEFVKYTANNPVLTNNVAANTPFTIKIAGRVNGLNYYSRTIAQRAQMYRIINWGEIGFTSIRDSFYQCTNLIGPIPIPRANSFINVTTFYRTFNGCNALTGNIPPGLFANCPNVTTFERTFYGCSGLVGSIPTGLFDNCPNVTTFAYTFGDCNNLTGSIPTSLFDNCPKVTTFYYAFANCSNLTGNIPPSLFANCSNITTFHMTFYNCSSLTGNIPPGLFDNCLNVTTFYYTFYSCSGLTGSIPTDLFANCPKVTTFYSTFTNCSNLTENIPIGLFDNCPNITSFAHTFNGCNALTGNIPPGLFDNCPNVTSFANTFGSCNSLTGNIPPGLFANCPKVTNFSSTFYNCSSLTGSIPESLFANCPNVTSFQSTFHNCSNLTGIPENLFSNCTNVTTFNMTFYYCIGLTGNIPPGLFDNCPNVTSFQSTFDDCISLTGSIPESLFANCPNVTNFSSTFFNCSSLTGVAPALWNTHNATSYSFCFTGCLGLSNRNDIPKIWGGLKN